MPPIPDADDDAEKSNGLDDGATPRPGRLSTPGALISRGCAAAEPETPGVPAAEGTRGAPAAGPIPGAAAGPDAAPVCDVPKELNARPRSKVPNEITLGPVLDEAADGVDWDGGKDTGDEGLLAGAGAGALPVNTRTTGVVALATGAAACATGATTLAAGSATGAAAVDAA
jgi:hypothetical protein